MIDLYYAPYSPPSRAVLLSAEAIGVSLNLKFVDTLKGEHLALEYEQICPEKKIPLLVDGKYKITESRAIIIYLHERYGKRNPRLYPSDPCGRALVNQALHFDIGILFKSIAQYYYPVIFKKEEAYSPEKFEKLKDAFCILNKMLENQEYVACRNLTLADLSLIVSVTTAMALGFDPDKYINVVKWIDKVKARAPGYKTINADGAQMLKQIVTNLKK